MRTLWLALLLIVACGDAIGSTPVVSLSGTWTGTMHGGDVEGITWTLALVETGGAVSGSARIGGTSATKYATVTGTFTRPDVALVIAGRGGIRPPVTLTGTVNATTLTGILNGSGFTGEAVVLTRTP